MPSFLSRVARFWWVWVGIGFAIPGFVRTVRHAHRPAWFWFFIALVPALVGVTSEWFRLWKRQNDESVELRAIGRRLRVELTTMEHDLDRVEGWRSYDGFVPLPSATWTVEGKRLAHLPEVFDPVAEAYMSADAFNKHISTRQAVTRAESLGLTPDDGDGIDALRAEIKKAKDALDRL